jgi:alpha-1,6-mannosyltransferase
VATPRALGRAGVSASLLSVVTLVVVAALGPSAVVLDAPPPGPDRSLGIAAAQPLVTSVVAVALLVAAIGVGLGWLALRRGWRPPLARVVTLGVGSVIALAVVPPMGSTDIAIYAAYGRMVVVGLNPYLNTVHDLVLRGDPIGVAYSGAWAGVPSVYGPVALAAQAVVAWLGSDSARLTVWLLQILAGVAFLGVAWLLDREARTASDSGARPRVALLWTLNPLLLYELVNAAHVDVLAVLLGVAALLVLRKSRIAAGALVALAVGVKVAYGLYVVAIAWALRREGARLVRYLLAGAITGLLVFASVWPEVLDPLRAASSYVASVSPWHPLDVWMDGRLAVGGQRWVITIGSSLLFGLVAWRARRALPSAGVADDGGQAIRGAALLSFAWLLTAPYALPWYCAIAWAPLLLVGASGLDLILLVGLASASISYLPGIVVATGITGTVTATLHGVVAPAVSLLLVGVVLVAGPRLRLPLPAGSPAP